MNILTINGSSRVGSFNQKFLGFLFENYSNIDWSFFDISLLPLFSDIQDNAHPYVQDWLSLVNSADGLIITSPEYLSNIPAALKNALEWLNHESNLAHKKVLPIICTPKEPRGNKAMQALLWSLSSLQSQILPSLHLYHHNFTSVNDSLLATTETKELLDACLENF